MHEDNIIEVKNLKTQFGDVVVHDGLNLQVRRGEVLGIVGGSGSGKSVLLRAILGLIQPKAGEIHALGHELNQLSAEDHYLVDQQWGVLFQDGALFSALTVAQNIHVVIKEYCKISKTLLDELTAIKIRMVGLPIETGDKLPSELSGGMRKRAGLARALALDPKIVFLDEPTAGLDPVGAAALDELIAQLQKTLGLTVVMITHDLDSLYAITDRIAVIAEKKVIVTAPLDELLDYPDPWIQNYFHGPRTREVNMNDGRH